MKPIQILLIIALLVQNLCAPVSAAAPESASSDEQVMKVAFAEDYPPFSWRPKDGSVQGILRDLLAELLESRLGVPVEYFIYPWASAQLLVEEGKMDAFFSIPTPARGLYTETTQHPLFVSDYYLYTGIENPNIALLKTVHSLEELKRLTDIRHVAMFGAGWHGTNLAGVTYIETVQDSRHIPKLLQFNRADVYLEQRPLMDYQIKALGYSGKILEIPNSMAATHWHLMISKLSHFKSVLPKLDALIASMEERGEYQKIQERVFEHYR